MWVYGAVAQFGELVDQLQKRELSLERGRVYTGRRSPHWTGRALQGRLARGVDIAVCLAAR